MLTPARRIDPIHYNPDVPIVPALLRMDLAVRI